MDTDEEGMPTWVKVLGVITLLLVGTFVVLALIGGDLGDHGPDRHAPSTGAWAPAQAPGSPSGLDGHAEPFLDGTPSEVACSQAHLCAGWRSIGPLEAAHAA